jgi:cytochrome b subunit of formate dehydrogenase
MNIFTWGASPWGQPIILHAAWWLLWVALAAAIVIILGHLVWTARRRGAGKGNLSEAVSKKNAVDLPEYIKRHSLAARLFHWIMAASVLTLLITAFLPKTGAFFDWVSIHVLAGMLFIATLIFHIIHAICYLDLRAIWPAANDWKEINETLINPPKDQAKPVAGKYPIGNKLFHLAVTAAALAMAATGFFMLWRVHNFVFSKNPYAFFNDQGWGVVYAIHGLAGLSLVTLVIVHIYFAIHPDKRPITVSMITGVMNREFYLTHHDPNRWNGNK